MSGIRGVGRESFDETTETARRVQVARDPNSDGWVVVITTLWKPWEEPLVSTLFLSTQAYSLLFESLFTAHQSAYLER